MTTFTYHRGQELPGIDLPWEAADGTPLDLSAGYTITVKLVVSDGTVVLDRAGVGYDGGVRIDWAAGDLDVDFGRYVLLVVARDAFTNDRVYSPGNLPQVMIVGPAVGGV